MQNADTAWTPFLTLLKKEVLRFWRVIAQTLLVPLVNSILYLLIFGVSLGESIHVSENWSYLAFLIPGLVMMGVLNNAFQNSSSSIATSKFHGDLEDLRMVPISGPQIIAAMATAGMVRGYLVGGVTFAVGQVFFRITQGTWLGIAHPMLLLTFLSLGGLSFALLGIVVAFRAKSIDQLSVVGGFVLLPLMYLGGVFFPLDKLHPFWQQLSKVNPMLYFINGVRHGILGAADIPVSSALAFTCATFAGLFVAALAAVRRGPYQRW